MRCESKGGAIMGKETVKNTYVLPVSYTHLTLPTT